MNICEICQKEFKPKSNTSGRFCSRSCSRVYTNKTHKGLYVHSCKECKNEFQHKSRNKTYCPKCEYKICKTIEGEYRQNNNEKKLLFNLVCKGCGLIFQHSQRNKFYCLNCKGRKEKGTERKEGSKRPPKQCLNCNKPLNYYNNFFCNIKCRHELKWKEFKHSLEVEGNIFKGQNLNKLKKYLIESRGHYCEICRITEWQGKPVPLVLDHINGKSSNNALSNLRLVCGNCDMQLPTYKSKNKNSDRNWRKKYNS